MTDQQQDLMIVEPKTFADFLKGRMIGDSVAEFSAKTGINQNLLYMLLQGKRKPSEEVLDAVGLRIVFQEKPRAKKK